MRMFWAMMAALAVVTGLLWAMSPDGGGQPGADDQPTAVDAGPIMPSGSGGSAVRENGSDVAPPDLADQSEPMVGDGDDDGVERSGDSPADGGDETPAADRRAERDVAPEAEALLDDLVEDFEQRAAGTGPALEGFGSDGPDLPNAERDDDGGFIVEGSGTEAEPYRITWDMLLSAADTYAPRLGKTALPEHIKKLDEAYVEITGYIAFPTAGENTEELLVMLNEWDGCCLGVPPSPYDAVEVRLDAPVAAERSIGETQYGTVRGRMSVDPYVIDDWLLGLYLMEEASVSIGM